MLIRISLISILTVTLFFSNAFSQSKLGGVAAQYLTLSPSARANGMGQTGAALVDGESPYFNPAVSGILALEGEMIIAPSMCGSLSGSEYSHYSTGIDFPLWSSRQKEAFAVGYRLLHLRSGEFQETNYQQAPTDRTFKWKDYAHRLSIAYGVRGSIEFAIGGSASYVRQSALGYSADGVAFSLGVLAGKKFTYSKGQTKTDVLYTFTPSIGLSLSSFGPDLSLLRDDYPLPRIGRIGVAVPCAYTDPGPFDHWERVSVTAALEYENVRGLGDFGKVGLEVGAFEALFVRVGLSGFASPLDNLRTVGFGISLPGVLKAYIGLTDRPAPKRGALSNFLINRVKIIYNQSSAEYAEMDDDPSTYRSVTLAIAL